MFKDMQKYFVIITVYLNCFTKVKSRKFKISCNKRNVTDIFQVAGFKVFYMTFYWYASAAQNNEFYHDICLSKSGLSFLAWWFMPTSL